MTGLRRVASAMFLFAAISCHGEKSIWTPTGEKKFTGIAQERWTGRPIPGAWIAATWMLDAGGLHAGPRCSINEVVHADSDGRYVLPYYQGRPPQVIEAFGHRYLVSPPPRRVTRDPRTMEWIIRFSKLENGKRDVASTQGPFSSREEALKAARVQQDVWLDNFVGTDDEWATTLSTFGISAEARCASFASMGISDWHRAVLSELRSLPDSRARQQAIDHVSARLAFAIGTD